jgi:hypothetical protein
MIYPITQIIEMKTKVKASIFIALFLACAIPTFAQLVWSEWVGTPIPRVYARVATERSGIRHFQFMNKDTVFHLVEFRWTVEQGGSGSNFFNLEPGEVSKQDVTINTNWSYSTAVIDATPR